MEFKKKLIRRKSERKADKMADNGRKRVKVRGRKRWIKPKKAAGAQA